jgi:hypothetical protein
MEGYSEGSSNGGMRNAAASAFGIVPSSEVTEDLPPMRAVSLMSQPATLQYSAPVSFGKAPAMGLKPLRSASVTVKKEWNESNWNIGHLEQVPLGFPLERTHREIHGADSTEVASRISSALQKLSVEAEYDGEKAKVKCTSLDMVSFRIRLFAGGEEGLPVVVEVQRRSGPPSSFMKICRQILDGAEGASVESASAPTTKLPPFVKGSIGSMKCLQSVVVKEEEKSEISALNKSMELLKSQQKDANLLGLENLCMLTDPLKTRPDRALNACKSIIIDEQCVELREEIGVILRRDAFLPEEFDEEEQPLVKKSHHLALLLLSNSLALASKDGCLAIAMESQKWFADVLIPTLIDEVKSFEVSPNNAYEAACSLTSLANCSDLAKKFMKENSAVEDLRSAHSYGLHNHELLASEAEQALIAMGGSI